MVYGFQMQTLTTLQGQNSFVHSLCVHEPTGKLSILNQHGFHKTALSVGLIFSGGTDGTLCVHDPRTSVCVSKHELAHSDAINSIGISTQYRYRK
jgi:hypothetical protein